MKNTSKILVGLFILIIAGLLSSNIAMKKEYDKRNKADIYWTYDDVLKQPFKHLKITGGNGTQIAYEQSAQSSVRISREWKTWYKGGVKAHVSNDTLYLNFDFIPGDQYAKQWIANTTTVRIFSPELLSIDGLNTNIELYKLKQKNLSIQMAGKSRFEVESLIPSFDSLMIQQKDSSVVIFEMSPDYHPPHGSRETMYVQYVRANLEAVTLLDLGHAQIKTLDLKIADSSSIILSGSAFKKVDK